MELRKRWTTTLSATDKRTYLDAVNKIVLLKVMTPLALATVAVLILDVSALCLETPCSSAPGELRKYPYEVLSKTGSLHTF